MELYELKPVHDSAKSFYNKATVKVSELGGKTLQSYLTDVAYIPPNKENPVIDWDANISATTLRHIKEFFKQNGLKTGTKAQMRVWYA